MNTTEYRNLAEQVLKNKEDILKHFKRDEVLADFGIRIIGTLQEAWELDDISTEGLQYGDAYAVGTKSPYDYYIWTRADASHPTDYWFNFGEIAIAGPAGPQGPRGPKGKDGESSRWYYFESFDYPDGYEPGSYALDSKGNVYYVGPQGQWELLTNIKGPQGANGKPGRTGDRGAQGPQGEKGEKGDVGGFINIVGIVDSEELLPDPTILDNLTYAYLVGPSNPRTLYIQVGKNSDEAQWLNTGSFNAATLVTVDGQSQNIWEANTKRDRIEGLEPFRTEDDELPSVVYTQSNGVDQWSFYSTQPKGGAFALWNASSSGAKLKSDGTPTEDNDVTNKAYVDDKLRDIGTNHVEVIYLTPDYKTWDSTINNALIASANYSYTSLKPDPKRLYAMKFPGTEANVNGMVCYPIESKISTSNYQNRPSVITILNYFNPDTAEVGYPIFHIQITTYLDGTIRAHTYSSDLVYLLPSHITQKLEYTNIPKVPDDTRLIGTFLDYDAYPEFCDMIAHIAYSEDDSYHGLPTAIFLCRGDMVTTFRSSWEEDQYYFVYVCWWSADDEAHLNFAVRYYENDGTYYLDDMYTS